MATYGKKKKSILPSFSAFRDSDAAPNNKSKRLGSISVSMPSVADSSAHGRRTAYSNDSIDEMASMLLNDTTANTIKETNHGRQPDLPFALSTPNIGFTGYLEEKILPQLPTLNFDKSPDEISGSSSLEASSLKKVTVPAIPRRSSKRRSAKPKSAFSPAKMIENDRPRSSLKPEKQGLKSSISAPILNTFPGTGTVGANDVHAKIQAMLAASAALKPNHDRTLPQGPIVPPKKRRLMDSNVFAKVKTVISDRFSVRSASKGKDPIRDDKLLDPSASELREFEEDSEQGLTSLEIRMNEGSNFRNTKVSKLTGQGRIRRKPIADDGKSLRSMKSVDDFSERARSSRSRTPTSSDNYLHDETWFDGRDEGIPKLPEMPKLPGLSRTPIREPQPNTRCSENHAGVEFDVSLSSSPLAQSTPRIRLEATTDDRRRIAPKNGLTSAISVNPDDLDIVSDMEIEIARSTLLEPTKRKEVNANDSIIRTSRIKKIKKHPSPSKIDLDNLERQARNFTPVSAANLGSVPSVTALAPKNTNTRVFGSTRPRFQDPELKKMERMPNVLGQAKPRKRSDTAMPKPSTQIDIEDESRMEIDELQWDESAYNIGERRC